MPRKNQSKQTVELGETTGGADPGLGGAVSAVEDETTLDRAESFPDEAEPAPEPAGSQEAKSLDELLASAAAPEDEDVDLSEEDLGPPQYTSLPRRTAPPKQVPFRIFPLSEGSKTLYMLALNRDAQEDNDQDTYPLAQAVRVALTSHPVFQKHIRRFQIRLGVTSLARPFFLEVNLDDQGVYGRTRRDLVTVAESEWILVSSDRSTGYSHHPSDHEGDLVKPAQDFEELFLLTYKSILITSTSHPVIKRGALRRAKPKAAKS
jgi:hypothetical protein